MTRTEPVRRWDEDEELSGYVAPGEVRRRIREDRQRRGESMEPLTELAARLQVAPAALRRALDEEG